MMISSRRLNPDPADRGGASKPTLADNNRDTLGQQQGKTNPDVDQTLAETGGAKATGGGLQPGTTDIGAPTAPMQGGRAGFASGDSARPAGGGSQSGPIGQGASPAIGAAGNSVSATGRPLENDARRGTGSAAVSGTNVTSQQESGNLQPGGTARSAADPSGVGTIGGGTAGTNLVGQARTSDATSGRTAGPEGQVAGGNIAPGAEAPLDPDRQTPAGTPEAWDRARRQSPPSTGTPPARRQP